MTASNWFVRLVLALGVIVAVFWIDGNTSVDAAVKCDPKFKKGAYKNKCPPTKNVPGYAGHTYTEIKVKEANGKTTTIYCDCGRKSNGCKVSSGGQSKTVGGKNGTKQTVTFKDDPKKDPPKKDDPKKDPPKKVDAYDIDPGVEVSPATVAPGAAITFTHTAKEVSGEPPASITWAGVPKREGPFAPDSGIMGLQSKDNRTLAASSGTMKSRVGFKTYTEGTTRVVVEANTPRGVKICNATKIAKAKVTSSGATSTKTSATVCATVARSDFNLVPKATIDNDGPAEPGEPIAITYRVENTLGNSNDESNVVKWSTYGIRVNPGVNTTSITDGTPRVDATPESLIQALGGQSKAQLFDVDKLKGERSFPAKSTTTLKTESFQLPPDTAAGAKYCFVISVTPPTQNASPANRHSTASCIVIGKKPKVNIWGGDLFVGRRFANDPVSPTTLNSSIQTSLSVYGSGSNRTYGSWTEYDAHATGKITGFATASGLQGGRQTTSLDQTQWSKLTFANKGNEFGDYAPTSARGTIPSTAEAATSGFPVVQTIPAGQNTLALPETNPDGRRTARYDKPTGNLTINTGTIQKNTSIVISAPKGTVTIAGDLNYFPGPYDNAREIPQLIIIAKNITINAGVKKVDGWLIAKAPADTPSGTNGSDPTNPIGVIKTCEVETNLTVALCNQRLTINGPVMANQLVLRRTAGLVGASATAAPPDDQPAEIFNLRAETYLWIYNQNTGKARANTTYSRELGPRF